MSTPELKPTNDLLHALAAWDVVETFQAMPLYDQDKFLAWIERAPGEDAYWRRIDIMVLGMRMAPHPGSQRSSQPEPDQWMNPMGRA